MTTTSTTPTMARRYYCPHSYKTGLSFNHDSGNGLAPRNRCRYCGGELTHELGRWGVFVYSRRNRYPLSGALGHYPREKSAQRRVDDPTSTQNLVVRWIPASDFATVSDRSVSTTGEVSPM